MRKLALILWALLTVNVMGLAPAVAETTWTAWGSAPYAASPDAAVRQLPDALQALNVPESVRARFLEEVRAHPEGTRVYLNPGDRFMAMMSGGRAPHAMLDVVVGTNPVRPGVVQSAEAREWRVEQDGRTYVLVRPDICNNWAWYSVPSPQEMTPEEECTVVEVAVHEGDTLAPAVFTGGSLPPSRCWAFKGSGDWEAWPGGCDHCINWTPALARVPEADRQVRMPGLVRIARSGTVWVRIPRQVESDGYHVAFVLIRDGLCSWGVIHHTSWSEHTFTISEGNWVWRRP